MPFFVKWLSDMALHPSNAAPDAPKISLLGLEIAGDPDRVDDWLGGHADKVLTDIDIKWVAPNGQPGVLAATFQTPNGEVRI